MSTEVTTFHRVCRYVYHEAGPLKGVPRGTQWLTAQHRWSDDMRDGHLFESAAQADAVSRLVYGYAVQTKITRRKTRPVVTPGDAYSQLERRALA